MNDIALRLFGSFFGILLLAKIGAYARSAAKPRSFAGLALYFLAWPGVDPAPFEKKKVETKSSNRRLLVRGLAMAGFGLALIIALTAALPSLPEGIAGWLGLFSLLITLHLGLTDALTDLFRKAGWPVGRLFVDPLVSVSLKEFWGRRWNMAFTQMSKLLFFPILRRRFGVKVSVLGVFAISGLLHEAVISFPAGSGWGTPFLYFFVHGVFVLVEPRVLAVLGPNRLLHRAWVYAAVLAPLPLLFHSGFRGSVIVPFFSWLREAAS